MNVNRPSAFRPFHKKDKIHFSGHFEIKRSDYNKMVENIAENAPRKTMALRNRLVQVRNFVTKYCSEVVRVGYLYSENERIGKINHFIGLTRNNTMLKAYSVVNKSEEISSDMIKFIDKHNFVNKV